MIEIKKKAKCGFDVLAESESFKVAIVTYDEQYGDLKIMKKHRMSDEVFILIRGGATLYYFEDGKIETSELSSENAYNIKRDTWHHLKLTEDAMLVGIENADTSKENTDVININELRREI